MSSWEYDHVILIKNSKVKAKRWSETALSVSGGALHPHFQHNNDFFFTETIKKSDPTGKSTEKSFCF